MATSKLSPQDMVASVHIWIAQHPSFCVFSGLSVCGETVVTDDGRAGPHNTAGTDGWNKFYHPEFLKSLSVQERRYLVLHELAHQAFHHSDPAQHVGIDMGDPEEASLANMAKDHFINTTLNAMDTNGDIRMPPGGQADPQYLNWDWRRIYKDLKQRGIEGDSMDYHIPGNAPGKSGLSPEEAARRKAQIDIALRQGKLMSERRKAQMGSGSSGIDLDAVLYPKVSWQDQLADFVTTQVSGHDEATWRKPNRKYLANGIYLPSLVRESLTKLVVVFDTSGSCFNSDEQVAFASELSGILESTKPEKVVVLYVDTEVVGHQEFDDGNFAVADLDVRGGGGTDLEVAYDWVEKNGHKDTQALIMFTDGYTEYSHPPSYPVLWVVTTDAQPTYGQTIKLQLE